MRIEPGQRWSFVDANGEVTEYLVGDPTDDAFMSEADRRNFWARWEPEDHPQNIVYLLNEATGKYAMVTRHWLYTPPLAGHSHWMAPSAVAA